MGSGGGGSWSTNAWTAAPGSVNRSSKASSTSSSDAPDRVGTWSLSVARAAYSTGPVHGERCPPEGERSPRGRDNPQNLASAKSPHVTQVDVTIRPPPCRKIHKRRCQQLPSRRTLYRNIRRASRISANPPHAEIVACRALNAPWILRGHRVHDCQLVRVVVAFKIPFRRNRRLIRVSVQRLEWPSICPAPRLDVSRAGRIPQVGLVTAEHALRATGSSSRPTRVSPITPSLTRLTVHVAACRA